MKKRFIGILLVASIAFGGCQKSTDKFLAYEDTVTAFDQAVDKQITKADFFAKDIAIVTDSNDNANDEQLTSGATLLINATDNEVRYADHAYDKMYPASLTKLLTALIALKYGELSDSVIVSENAVRISDIGAKVCGYKEGDVLSLEALLNSMLIYSGNDAAIAIAEHIGGSEEAFVKMMNKEAQFLGAVHSNFVNSHGLHDDNQYTTAYDMYLILNELLSYDAFYNMISKKTYTSVYKDKDNIEREITLNSINAFINGEVASVNGIKVVGGLSGTTNKAGNCLILISNDNHKKEYISIILKAKDNDTLYTQMSHLLSLAVAEK